jgi:PII-like signaling protein
MLAKGKARKLTVYINEGDTRHGKPLYVALVELARKHGLAGATVSRAVMGFGAGGRVHTLQSVELATHMPLKVEIVDTAEAIDHLLPDVYDLVDEGLVEMSDVEVVKFTAPKQVPGGKELSHMKLEGKAKMLRIHIGAADKWQGEPLAEALLKRFHQLDLAGATVYRGQMGYGASGRVHRRRIWRSADEPITVVVVDTSEKLEQAMPSIDEMVGSGMVVMSDVDVIFYREQRPGAPGPA